jgi:N-acetylglucosaminyl-diphospho-decaprenol L-rhamnosyltransferase
MLRAMTRPEAAVYVPTTGGSSLRATLVSLAEQSRPTPVVVIDNSDGAPVETVTAEFENATLVRVPAFSGPGIARNAGVAAHPAGRLLFLDDDVVCARDFVARMLDEAPSRLGSVAGVLLQGADQTRIDSAGIVADRSLMGFDYLNNCPLSALESSPAPLGPTAAAALVTLDAFELIGGFDPLIWLYYDDLDLVLRLRAAGAECRLAAGARGLHAYSSTFGAASPRKYALSGKARGYMIRRYGVLRRPGTALHAIACEAALCAGQLALDRTGAGIRGRVTGWRSARGLPLRSAPVDGLLDLSVSAALRLRAVRRDLPLATPPALTRSAVEV